MSFVLLDFNLKSLKNEWRNEFDGLFKDFIVKACFIHGVGVMMKMKMMMKIISMTS